MKTTITKCDCCQEERREGCGTPFASVKIDYVDIPEEWNTMEKECVFLGYPPTTIDICFECAKLAGIVKFKDKPKNTEHVCLESNVTNDIES